MGLLDFFWKMKETDAEAELKEMQEMMKLMDPSNVKFQGGDGFAQGTAVVVKGATMFSGPMGEQTYIGGKFGKHNVDWTLISQSVRNDEGRRSFDVFELKLKDGRHVSFYFDITSYTTGA